jgi:hypothetical protein
MRSRRLEMIGCSGYVWPQLKLTRTTFTGELLRISPPLIVPGEVRQRQTSTRSKSAGERFGIQSTIFSQGALTL